MNKAAGKNTLRIREETAEEQLRSILQHEFSGESVVVGTGNSLRIRTKDLHLQVEIKWRDSLLVGHVVEETHRTSLLGQVPVFATAYINPELHAFLEARRINAFDLAGNCYLRFERHGEKENALIVIVKTGNKPAKAMPVRRPLLTPSSYNVLMALLTAPQCSVSTIRDLAERAMMSVGGTQQVCARLREFGFLRYSKKDPITVLEPGKLVDLWGDYYVEKIAPRITRIGCVVGNNVPMREIYAALQAKEIPYYLTGVVAAQKWSDYYTSRVPEIYVDNAHQVIRYLVQSTFPIAKTGREPDFIVLEAYSPVAFIDGITHNGLPIVNPVQVYLDLLASPDSRANELAAYVRKALGY